MCCDLFWFVTGLCFVSFEIVVFHGRAVAMSASSGVVLSCKLLFRNILKCFWRIVSTCPKRALCDNALWKNPSRVLLEFLRLQLCNFWETPCLLRTWCERLLYSVQLGSNFQNGLVLRWYLLLPGREHFRYYINCCILPSESAYRVVTLPRRTDAHLFLQTDQNLCNPALLACDTQQMSCLHPQIVSVPKRK